MAFSRIDNLHVETRDGTYISCNVFLPGRAPVQAANPEETLGNFKPEGDKKCDIIFEYIPYRKDDMTFSRDHSRHGFFAQKGYATIRADMRGTGDSGGKADHSKDAADTKDVMDYFLKMEWASGKVFLFGMSWGGTIALEVAAKFPDHVSGCVILCTCGDRNTALNFTQSAIIASELLPFANLMLARHALPIKRGFNKEEWLKRLEAVSPDDWIYPRLKYQEKGAIKGRYSDPTFPKAAKCPMLMITGLRDWSQNGVFTLSLETGLNSSSKVILGPWAHSYPDIALPKVNFDLMGLTVSWFKQDQKAISLPRISVYCENTSEWMTPEKMALDTVDLNFETSPRRLANDHVMQALWGGAWYTVGIDDDPGDQTISNDYCTTWNVPIPNNTILCGIPKISIDFDNPPDRFYIAATLCNKTASGTKQLTYGISYFQENVISDMEMGGLCYCHKGGELILSLKTHYFPMVPNLPTESPIIVKNLSIGLPILKERSAGSSLFEIPVSNMPKTTEKVLKESCFQRNVRIDLGGSTPDNVTVSREVSAGHVIIPDFDVEYEEYSSDSASIDFAMTKSPEYSANCCHMVKQDGVECRTFSKTKMVVERDRYKVRSELKALLDGHVIFDTSWERCFERNS